MEHSKLIGFWRSHPEDGLPHPASLDEPYPRPLKSILIHYLSSHAYIESYEQAYSFCRFQCPESQANPVKMGLTTLTDGRGWIWPEGLSHYVSTHNVGLPQDFVLHVLNVCRSASPPALHGDPVSHVDDPRCDVYCADLPRLLPVRNHLLLGPGDVAPIPLPKALAAWLTSRTAWLKPEGEKQGE